MGTIIKWIALSIFAFLSLILILCYIVFIIILWR